MRRSHAESRPAVAAALALLLLAACGKDAQPPRTDAGPEAGSGPAADPKGIVPTRRAIAGTGAAAHDQYASQGIQCQACHPCGEKATAHDAAWMDPATPTFHAYAADSGIASCQSCHGALLDGVGGATTVACAQCHGAAWKTDCTMCHGGTDGPTGAPPRATWGHAGDAVRVGAHTSHVGATHGLAAPVACDACHVKPADALSAGHLDAATATVTFFGLASQQAGAPPAWDRAAATCSNTYCHGATLAGGTRRAPVWTTADGSQRTCDACHGAPPPSPHVARSDCGSCHPGYTATAVNAATHVDGKVDLAVLTCTTCHGTSSRTGIAGADPNQAAAPPVDVSGDTSVAARGVGVHVQHVNQATWRDTPLACSECHAGAVPTSTSHADGTVQLAFGPLARSSSWGGVTPAPTWNGTTCASTYCHGAFKNGAAATVTWTQAGGVTCGSCHGAPPSGGHPQNANCGGCHTGYTSTSVNRALHLNGALDVNAMTCTSCHGSAGQTATAAAPRYAAPPVDTLGASTGLRVGAHQSHVAGKTYTNGVACQDCHPAVAGYTSTHSNGVTDVAFTNAGPATLGGGTFTPRSGTTPASCAATACHAVKSDAGSSSGGTLSTPTWTGSITACTACHAVPPSTGRHGQSEHRVPCGYCHPGYASTTTANSTTVNKAVHVNGLRDVGGTGTRIESWNAATHSCNPTCHGTETWR